MLDLTPNGTAYSDVVAEYILREIANGRTLKDVCSEPGIPPIPTVLAWVTTDKCSFGRMYRMACQQRALLFAEDIIEIADDDSNDLLTNSWGFSVPNTAAIQRSKIRISTRTFLMGKWLPEAFGDKSEVTHTVNGTTSTIDMDKLRSDPVEAARAYAQLMGTPSTTMLDQYVSEVDTSIDETDASSNAYVLPDQNDE